MSVHTREKNFGGETFIIIEASLNYDTLEKKAEKLSNQCYKYRITERFGKEEGWSIRDYLLWKGPKKKKCRVK